MFPWAGDRASPPGGFLLCDGSAVSRATYAGLFAAIGTTYGAGDGSTTFNLPDARDRFLRGEDDGTNTSTGDVGGANTHAHGAGSLQADSHQHGAGTLQADNHSHSPFNNQSAPPGSGGGVFANDTLDATATVSGSTAGATAAVSGTTGVSSSVPRFLSISYVIKT